MNLDDPRCPECGAPVHLNASACRHCGARKGSAGWQRSERYDGLDLPEDDDFDYAEFVAREFGEGQKAGWRGWEARRRFWCVVAVITLIAFTWMSLYYIGL